MTRSRCAVACATCRGCGRCRRMPARVRPRKQRAARRAGLSRGGDDARHPRRACLQRRGASATGCGPGRDRGRGHGPELHERDVRARHISRVSARCRAARHRVRGPHQRGRRGRDGPRGGRRGRRDRARFAREPCRRRRPPRAAAAGGLDGRTGRGIPGRLRDGALRARHAGAPAARRAGADPCGGRRRGARGDPGRAAGRGGGLRRRPAAPRSARCSQRSASST